MTIGEGIPMDTPLFSQFLQPILQALREGGGSLTQVEMVDAVDRLMRFPEAIMERRHARYSMVREFDYCLALAQAYLKKVGYLTRSTRGVWVLTAEGKTIDVVDERSIVAEVRKDYRARRKAKQETQQTQESIQEILAPEALYATKLRTWDRVDKYGLLIL